MNKRAIINGLIGSAFLWGLLGLGIAGATRHHSPTVTATPIRTPNPFPTGEQNNADEMLHRFIKPSASATPTPAPKCPYVANFQPGKVITLGKYKGETVLDDAGCPAVLILIPVDKNSYDYIKDHQKSH